MTSNAEAAGGPAAPELRAVIGQRMLIADGALGSMLQGSPATPDDLAGYEGCEYGISDRISELAEAGARIARQAADRWSDEARDLPGPEEFQLAPGQSTDALIAHHPEAKYFSTR